MSLAHLGHVMLDKNEKASKTFSHIHQTSSIPKETNSNQDGNPRCQSELLLLENSGSTLSQRAFFSSKTIRNHHWFKAIWQKHVAVGGRHFTLLTQQISKRITLGHLHACTYGFQ